MWSSRYACHVLISRLFYQRNFEETSNIKFIKKPVKVEPSCSMRTDEQTNKLIVAFRSFASTPKNVTELRLNICHKYTYDSTGKEIFRHKIQFFIVMLPRSRLYILSSIRSTHSHSISPVLTLILPSHVCRNSFFVLPCRYNGQSFFVRFFSPQLIVGPYKSE